MVEVVNVNDVLDGHVVLDLDCLDRIYLVLDAFSRKVVGWSIDSQPATSLVTNALGMAIQPRRPAGPTVSHSDKGTQFTSWAFTQRARDSGLLASIGAVGTCYDNALMEAFWSRVQVELLGPAGLEHAP